MKTASTLLLAVVVALTLTVPAFAADKDDDPKTLKGTICCGKCELKKSDKCATVIVVKDGDKETVYWFDDASSKENHKKICTTPMKGEVKGAVKKEGDKMIVTVKEIKFAD
jgi:hypothetical protein